MAEPAITADYLIKGAGATAMAFADTLLTETEATMVLVDRHDRPGGHWNDAYPFVRLHQPSKFYGVPSAPLGSGCVDEVGLNAGFHELAAGHEVLAHFDAVMRHRFLPSGRVTYLPMSQLDDGGTVTSLLSGKQYEVTAGRFVDATHSKMRVPSTSPPSFAVGPDVAFVPLNDLPRVAPDHERFVVIGAGKTGMDACVWLLDNGADPARITWIVSRDAWVLNRANFQPGEEFFARFSKSLADQVEAVVEADSVDDVLLRLEACDELHRVDPTVTPEAYHCAILSDGELAQLRRIGDVVRLGHVTSIDAAEIRLDHGTIPTGPSTLHVDCSAAGIPTHPSTPIFDGDRITLQWVRTCQPAFSAAFIGHVEATYGDEAEKNRLCTPIVPPTVPVDWLRMFQVELANRTAWGEVAEIGDWLAASRLDPVAGTIRTRLGVDTEATEHLGRYLANMAPAAERLDQLLAD
ncbi:MAG: NAD(P)/FAD-dependent oxidoreductase [Acidimicrobiales bacterium]